MVLTIFKKYPAKVSLRGSDVLMNYINLLRRSSPVYFFYLGLETLDFFCGDYSGLADLAGECSFSAVLSVVFSVSSSMGSADGVSFNIGLSDVVSFVEADVAAAAASVEVAVVSVVATVDSVVAAVVSIVGVGVSSLSADVSSVDFLASVYTVV